MEQSLWKWVALSWVAVAGVMVFLRLVTNEIQQRTAALDQKKHALERQEQLRLAAEKRRKQIEQNLAGTAGTTPAPSGGNGRTNGHAQPDFQRRSPGKA
jgi:heme exporter protein D